MCKKNICLGIIGGISIFLVLNFIIIAFLTIHRGDNHYDYVPHIVAHRGGIKPDNMYENIVQVLDLDFIDGIEVDVQMSKDGVIVLFHDDDLSPQTNGDGPVKEYNFDYLKTLNMEYNDPELSSYNFRITTLEDVISYMKHSNKADKILHLDIKQENITLPIVRMLLDYNMTGPNIIFDASNEKINNQVHEIVSNHPYFVHHKMSGSILNSIKAYFNFMYRGGYNDRNLVLYYTNNALKPFLSKALNNYFHKREIATGVYGPHINNMDIVNHYIKKKFDYVLMDIKYNH